MGISTQKGELGEAEVIAALEGLGYDLAIPFGHASPST